MNIVNVRRLGHAVFVDVDSIIASYMLAQNVPVECRADVRWRLVISSAIPHEDKLLVLINRAHSRNLTLEPNTIDLVTTEMTKLVNVVASDGLMAINFRLRSSRSINGFSDEEPK